MNIRLGDSVADVNKLSKHITLGSIKEIEQDWVPLFLIEWDDGRIWRVKEEVAIELRQNFLDNIGNI